MSMGTTIRRGAFFAAPAEVLGAVKLYCEDLYGSMLAGLDSGPAGQLMNCWAKTVKDVWYRRLTASTLGGANNALILSATGFSTWTATTAEVRAELQSREVAMAPEETSKVDYLLELLQTRAELSLQCEDITGITAHIYFLVIF